MISSARPDAPASRRRVRRLAAVLLTVPPLVLTAVAVPSPGAARTSAPSASTGPAGLAAARNTAGSDVTMVTANLRSPQPYRNFQRDARTVTKTGADFITYNEVSFRNDVFLAPKGYALWRSSGRYQAANPVAWRTDRWRAVAKGTRQMSSYSKVPPGRKTLLGMRYANWVTLKSRTGDRVVSVVSMHAAPKVRGMPDLRRPAVRALGGLVDGLADRGPVLVGGDFNFHFRSKFYPADLLAQAKLAPTYQLLGTKFPTGDHHGATIDFVFVRGAGQLAPDVHYPVELNSDHDAVVAGLSWSSGGPTPPTPPTAPSGPRPTPTTVRNDPGGAEPARRAVVQAMANRIGAVRRGGLINLSTAGLTLWQVQGELVDAVERGVRVRYLTRSRRTTGAEGDLRSVLKRARGSAYRECGRQCERSWKGQPPTVLLVRARNGAPSYQLAVNRRLRDVAIERATVGRLRTDPKTLAATARRFDGR